MLFNSPIFFLGFLPLAWFSYRWFSARGLGKWHLIVTSLIFYGYWDIRLLPLLIAAILVTWSIVALGDRLQKRGPAAFLGIVANLLLLAYFKYMNFFAAALADLGMAPKATWNIILPLAISFYTFHQISYLVDYWKNNAPLYRLSDYFLYIVFFPHLIAGPIVRHNEFIYQIENAGSASRDPEYIARGLMLFVLGLAKKIWLADPLGAIVDPKFVLAKSELLSASDATVATLGFAFQIYFDFSGYTDMAIGLALLFGYILPQNFQAPYRAVSLIDFWRRWHITLSRFLRDYLYIPLGGNRHGPIRQFVALILTMTLGGLWHGANWTFVVWGVLHGAGITINHKIRSAQLHVPEAVGWLVTFLFVAATFVIFRAVDLAHARNVLSGMFLSPLGATKVPDVLLLIAAAGFAILGPSNHDLVVERASAPGKAWGLGLGFLCAATIVFILSSDSGYEPFIYFQF